MNFRRSVSYASERHGVRRILEVAGFEPVPSAAPRLFRLPIVEIGKGARANKRPAAAQARHRDVVKNVVDARQRTIAAAVDFGPGIFDPASDRQPRRRLHGDAAAEYRVFVFEVTVVDAPRTWTDAEKVFLRIVLPAPECSERHPSAREIRHVEPRLDRPIPFERGGGPYAEGAFAIEQPAIAESGAVREPAAGREAAQLQMEAVRSSEESRQAFFGDLHSPLEPVSLVRFEYLLLLIAFEPQSLGPRLGDSIACLGGCGSFYQQDTAQGQRHEQPAHHTSAHCTCDRRVHRRVSVYHQAAWPFPRHQRRPVRRGTRPPGENHSHFCNTRGSTRRRAASPPLRRSSPLPSSRSICFTPLLSRKWPRCSAIP